MTLFCLALLPLPLLQSKASPLGAVLSMAAGGKATSKKQLGLMMQAAYGDHLYVASVCLEADHKQVRVATSVAGLNLRLNMCYACFCVVQVRGQCVPGGKPQPGEACGCDVYFNCLCLLPV